MTKKPESRPLPSNLPNSVEWCRQQYLETGNPYYVWNVIFWSGMFDFGDLYMAPPSEQLSLQEDFSVLEKIFATNFEATNRHVEVPGWVAMYLAGVAVRFMAMKDSPEDAAYVLGLRPPPGEPPGEYLPPSRGPGLISQAHDNITRELVKVEVTRRVAQMQQSNTTDDGSIIDKVCADVVKEYRLSVTAGTVKDWYNRKSKRKK